MRTTIKNRMMIGASLLMMTFSLCLTDANAQTCAKVPTCEELGYTKTCCQAGKALKCPFDQTKLFCGEECQAGDIYYSDNTCSHEYEEDKQVVGIVAGDGLIIGYMDVTGGKVSLTWEEAKNACEGVKTGGKSWRLPTVEEGQLIATHIDDIENTLKVLREYNYDPYWVQFKGSYFWSSRTVGQVAYYFNSGHTGFSTTPKTEYHRVICVFDF